MHGNNKIGHCDNVYTMYKITDDKLINCGFDLAFHHYVVSYYTTYAQHSSDKIAKGEFKSLQ